MYIYIPFMVWRGHWMMYVYICMHRGFPGYSGMLCTFGLGESQTHRKHLLLLLLLLASSKVSPGWLLIFFFGWLVGWVETTPDTSITHHPIPFSGSPGWQIHIPIPQHGQFAFHKGGYNEKHSWIPETERSQMRAETTIVKYGERVVFTGCDFQARRRGWNINIVMPHWWWLWQWFWNRGHKCLDVEWAWD